MSDYLLDSVDVVTDAGTYVINVYHDDDARNPLTEFDHEGTAILVVGPRNSVQHDSLDDAGPAGDALATLARSFGDGDDTARRYAKWRAITGSSWQLVIGSGNGAMQGDWWDWYALVDTSAGWGPNATPESIANGVMSEYDSWASGEAVGYVVVAPDGENIDSVWGFYGDADREYMIDEARAAVAHDVAGRQKKANLVGAGFMGLI